HVKSITKATQIARETKDALQARAVALYQHKQGKELQAGEKKLSLCTVCRKIEAEHAINTRKTISLDPRTLLQHVSGGKTLSTSNVEKDWLLPEEVDIVIKFATEVGSR
ncbi:hypothetical protein C8R45DRAFT_764234, partial [Mycena sanguinolenta]